MARKKGIAIHIQTKRQRKKDLLNDKARLEKFKEFKEIILYLINQGVVKGDKEELTTKVEKLISDKVNNNKSFHWNLRKKVIKLFKEYGLNDYNEDDINYIRKKINHKYNLIYRVYPLDDRISKEKFRKFREQVLSLISKGETNLSKEQKLVLKETMDKYIVDKIRAKEEFSWGLENKIADKFEEKLEGNLEKKKVDDIRNIMKEIRKEVNYRYNFVYKTSIGLNTLNNELEYSDTIIEFDTSTELIEKARSINEDIADKLEPTGINTCLNEDYPNETHAGWRILKLEDYQNMNELEKKAERCKYKYIGTLKEQGRVVFNEIGFIQEKFGISTVTVNRIVEAVENKDYKRLRTLKNRFAKVKDYLMMDKRTEQVFNTPPDHDTIKHITDEHGINSQTIYDILNEFGLKQNKYDRSKVNNS